MSTFWGSVRQKVCICKLSDTKNFLSFQNFWQCQKVYIEVFNFPLKQWFFKNAQFFIDLIWESLSFINWVIIFRINVTTFIIQKSKSIFYSMIAHVWKSHTFTNALILILIYWANISKKTTNVDVNMLPITFLNYFTRQMQFSNVFEINFDIIG